MARAHRRDVALLVLVGALAGLAGCSIDARVSYAPQPPPAEPAAATVALKVVDARAAGFGGQDPTRVGNIRNGYGMPFPVHENGPERVAQLVTQATTDALKQAGVAVAPDGQRTLVTTVKGFWVDGYAGYKAVVEVDLALQDQSGKPVWSKSVNGGAGGVHWVGLSIAEELLTKALNDYAQQAAAEFKTRAFQAAVF